MNVNRNRRRAARDCHDIRRELMFKWQGPSSHRLRRPPFAKFYISPTYQPLEDRRMLTSTNENGQTDGETEFFMLPAQLLPVAQQFFKSNEMIASGPSLCAGQ